MYGRKLAGGHRPYLKARAGGREEGPRGQVGRSRLLGGADGKVKRLLRVPISGTPKMNWRIQAETCKWDESIKLWKSARFMCPSDGRMSSGISDRHWFSIG